MDIIIHNAVEYHSKHVQSFLNSFDDDDRYHSVEVIDHSDEQLESQARDAGLQHCADLQCDYYLSIDANAHIDEPDTLNLLIEQNRDVVAPIISRPYHAWSNFWGSLNKDEFYGRSADYMDIVNRKKIGLWNVPYISSIYLINGKLITDHPAFKGDLFTNGQLDPDMSFCKNLRSAGIFMYASNRLIWGHLVFDEEFKTDRLHNELWEINNNRWDWYERYIHKNYTKVFEQGAKLEEPCPDVFWFPIISDRFADELVATMENYGQWSSGSNVDARLDGGYENVPTRDIHMKQVGYQDEWLSFLDLYVKPLVQLAFKGYDNTAPKATMNFVVRYRPDEQPSLRPHNDASTYTTNIALNQVGKDYEGGGCRFLRYDCSVTSTRKGWMMMHPGRLTHNHEGLPTTKNTRYIMVSFIDP